MTSVFSGCDFAAGWVSDQIGVTNLVWKMGARHIAYYLQQKYSAAVNASQIFSKEGHLKRICGLIVGHPLDTIKVWKQTIPEKSSTTKVAITLFRLEGIKGFYKGLMFPLLTAGALNSLFFGVYGNTMRVLQEIRQVEKTTCWNGEIPYAAWHWDVFYSGCAGGFFSLAISCPMELVKTQMQTQTRQPNLVTKRMHQYSGPWSCLIDQYKSRGILGCYRGFVPLLWRDVGAYGLYMSVYAHTSQHLPDKHVWSVMLAGATSGLVSWASVVPLDVIKSRVQADSKTEPKYKGMLDCAIKSYRSEGIQVFFRGFWVIVLRALPVNAVTFVGYEYFISLCKHL